MLLRRLLERQAACLVRVRLDGVVIACNQAAAVLFGISERRAVLNSNLVDRLAQAGRSQWHEFVARCSANGAASFECHLVIRDSDARPVLLEGVPLADHPDGVESLLLHLRDQSQTQQPDHSIESAGIDHVENDDRRSGDQIDAALVQRVKLAVLADEDQAECQQLVEALEAQAVDRERREARVAELEKKLNHNRLVLLQKEREYGRDVAMLKSALAAAHAARASAVAGAEKQEPETTGLRLQAATAEQQRLQALVAEYEIDGERIAAGHQAAVDTLQQSLARAREEAALDIEQLRQALADSRLALTQALAEQTRTAARVEAAEGELAQQRAEHQRALLALEASKDAALAELRSQLSQAFVDQRRLASHADAQELELNRVRAEHQAALADRDIRHRDALAVWRRELAHTTELAEQHEQERDRISADHALAIADLQASHEAAAAELRSNLSAAVAEQQRLAVLLEEQERERERLTDEHRRAIAELQASKQEAVADCKRVLTEVQEALLLRDTSRRLEVERRLVDGIDEGPQINADLQHEPFDDADDAFVQQLLEGIHGNRYRDAVTKPKNGGPAVAVSEVQAPKRNDQPAEDIFDANDATFARRLMDTLGPLTSSSDAEDS